MDRSNTVIYNNSALDSYVTQIAGWHHARRLIDGSTDQAQFEKLLEEVIELFAAINPGKSPDELTTMVINLVSKLNSKGKIKTDEDGSGLRDAIGDVNVVLVNIAERNNLTMQNCFATAWGDIKDRKGKMINGIFVKDE